MDERARESLAMDVAGNFTGQDVVELLRHLCAVRGCPAYVRSDGGPEFSSSAVQKWLEKAGAETLYIAPGSPGGMVISSHSTAGSEMSCSVESCS
jgi:transposase InsO family protein